MRDYTFFFFESGVNIDDVVMGLQSLCGIKDEDILTGSAVDYEWDDADYRHKVLVLYHEFTVGRFLLEVKVALGAALIDLGGDAAVEFSRLARWFKSSILAGVDGDYYIFDAEGRAAPVSVKEPEEYGDIGPIVL